MISSTACFSSWPSSHLTSRILYLLVCLFVSAVWALEYKYNEGRDFILFILNLQGLEKCLAHSRHLIVKWKNKCISRCVSHEHDSKISISKDCIFWKVFWSTQSTKVRTKMNKNNNKKKWMAIYEHCQEFSRKIQSIHWLNVRRRYVTMSICFFVTLDFTIFETSTTIKIKK